MVQDGQLLRVCTRCSQAFAKGRKQCWFLVARLDKAQSYQDRSCWMYRSLRVSNCGYELRLWCHVQREKAWRAQTHVWGLLACRSYSYPHNQKDGAIHHSWGRKDRSKSRPSEEAFGARPKNAYFKEWDRWINCRFIPKWHEVLEGSWSKLPTIYEQIQANSSIHRPFHRSVSKSKFQGDVYEWHLKTDWSGD